MSFLYRPSSLLAFLEESGISAKKKWSQNFLIDGNIIRNIVREAKVLPGEPIIEIGPGPGGLTEALLSAGAHIIAIEKDPELAPLLERLQTEDQRLKVICADALSFPYETVTGAARPKVVANLPYHITTPLLVALVTKPHLFSSLTVMVQKEVAERFVAKQNSSAYSSFTLFLSYYAEVRLCFSVARTCFYPAPKVDSAVVQLILKENLPLEDPTGLFAITRAAFQQRRKMLRASLKGLYPQEALQEALASIGKSETCRPEELSLNDFITVYRRLSGT